MPKWLSIKGLLVGLWSTVEPNLQTDTPARPPAMSVQPDGPVDGKIKILASACDSAAKHSDDYAKSLVALDAKAQGAATISGIILAAFAVFFKDGDVAALAKTNHCWLFLILPVPIAALITVALSVWSAWIAEVTVPADAPGQIADAETVLAVDDGSFSKNHVVTFYQKRLNHWKEAFESIVPVMGRKALRIQIGQGFMLTSLLLLLVLFVVVLLR
jgi:hypothetical protein